MSKKANQSNLTLLISIGGKIGLKVPYFESSCQKGFSRPAVATKLLLYKEGKPKSRVSRKTASLDTEE